MCKDESVVWRYDRDGSLLGKLTPNRPFVQPTDILAMKSGQIVVRDEQGLQLFAENGKCAGCLGKQIDHCYGLAEDVDGRLVTINRNQERKIIHVTSPGQTDVFYIDVASDTVVFRVELQDVIVPEEKTRSMCRSLACHGDKLYVVDQGLNRILIIPTEVNSQDPVLEIGDQGQFKSPSGLIVDDLGVCLVVDTRHHRFVDN